MKNKSTYNLALSALAISLVSLPVLAKDTEMEASAGLAYDSNIYRTPDKTYSYGVTPTQDLQSGLFVPLDFSYNYKKARKKRDGFFADYDFNGDFYIDSKFSNANDWKQEAGSRKLVLVVILHQGQRHVYS